MSKYLVSSEDMDRTQELLGELVIQMVDMGYDEYDEQVDELGDRLITTSVGDDAVILDGETARALYEFMKEHKHYIEKTGDFSEDGDGTGDDDQTLADLNKFCDALHVATTR